MRDSVQQAATNIETSVQSELKKTETELNQAIDPTLSAAVSPVARPRRRSKKEEAFRRRMSARSPAHEAAGIVEKSK
jgi:hypothetical protein